MWMRMTAQGDLVMFEFMVPPGARVPEPHYHEAVDEVVYGLEGTMTTMRDGERHEIRPGESLLIRRGQVHHHSNLGDVPAKAMVVLNPGSIGLAVLRGDRRSGECSGQGRIWKRSERS